MCGKKGEFHEVVGEGDDHSAREGMLDGCLPARVVVKCYLKRHDVSDQFDQYNPTTSHHIGAETPNLVSRKVGIEKSAV